MSTLNQLRARVAWFAYLERLHIQKFGVFPKLPSNRTPEDEPMNPDVLAEGRAITAHIRKLTRMANRARIAQMTEGE